MSVTVNKQRRRHEPGIASSSRRDVAPDLAASPLPLSAVALLLNPQDDVAIARRDLPAGGMVSLDAIGTPQALLSLRQAIPAGHKLALRSLSTGAPVRRYGQVIGFASCAIAAGDHVHSHNLEVRPLARPPVPEVFSASVGQPISWQAAPTFLGYQRPSGQVGTRNYVAVLATVNCSAHTAQQITRHFSRKRLAAFPNVDGVVAFTHAYGCTTAPDSPDHRLLQRTLAGIARHPNVGGVLLVGLGCEANQISDLVRTQRLVLDSVTEGAPRLLSLCIQDEGGIRKAVRRGIALVEELLAAANTAQRTPQPVSELTLALQCGGSDSWSGVTANPLMGLVSDALVAQGGRVLLAETTELYGAEHLLVQRAASPEVAQRLLERIRWWEERARQLGLTIDNNPSPGNKAGGLTTIYEKSLGAMTKGGSTPLMAVYDYAEPVVARGLSLMDTPGNDPVSVTGQVAGGCNLVLFSTGRGSVFGGKPAPVIKICSNSATFAHMRQDMDFNAGIILEGTSLDQAAAQLMQRVVAVASGQPTRSEAQGVGEAEFVPWHLGSTL